MAAAVQWYQQGRISQEWAARIAEMDRTDFTLTLSQLGKDSFHIDFEDLDRELARADRAIINASPLIFFSRSRHLQLLRAFADELWVPEPVAAGILHRGSRDVSARAIQETKWLTVHPAGTVPDTIAAWAIGS